MSISWTKSFTSSDDGTVLTGAQLGTLQSDIDSGAGDVSAAAVIGATKVVRGKDGSRGIQESTAIINDDGEMTNPSQPCFMVVSNANQTNLAIGGAVTILFQTEIKDQGSDFASNTFTVPITGSYQLNFSIELNDIDTAAAYIAIQLVTSNRTYRNILDPGLFSGDVPWWTLTLSAVADMDINDTAYLAWYQSGGTAQTDAISGGTFFSGVLLN